MSWRGRCLTLRLYRAGGWSALGSDSSWLCDLYVFRVRVQSTALGNFYDLNSLELLELSIVHSSIEHGKLNSQAGYWIE